MYQDRRQAYPGESAIESRRQIGALIDVHSETLRGWVERVEVDAGARPGSGLQSFPFTGGRVVGSHGIRFCQ